MFCGIVGAGRLWPGAGRHLVWRSCLYMEVHTGTRRFGLPVGIAAGAVAGAALMAFAEIRGSAAAERVGGLAEFFVGRLDWRWDWWLMGALAGGFAGAFGWMLSKPRIRLARGTLAVMGINWAAWVVFLAFTPQVEVEEIARQRAAGIIVAGQDAPTILAARYFGGYRPISPPEIWLFLMAGPAASIAEQNVVPGRDIAIPPTRRESYVIAVIAFVISTAFWASLSGAIGSLRRLTEESGCATEKSPPSS